MKPLWQSILLALWAVTAAAADRGPRARLESAGTLFAHDIAAKVSDLLFDAGEIDRVTMQEQTERRNQRLRRQEELARWFSHRQRDVRWQDCQTAQDRLNFRDFPTLMANRGLLELGHRDRTRFIVVITSMFAAMEQVFGQSLGRLITPSPGEGTPLPRTRSATQTGQGMPLAENATMQLANTLCSRLEDPVSLRTRYFGRTGGTTTGAMYDPAQRTVYLNLNLMVSAPEAFIDAFEHELWHHLLPVPPDNDDVARNLWQEGFTEAVAEVWGDELLRLLPDSARNRSASVEYPVQVAFCSLYIGVARLDTLQYLAGAGSLTTFADRLRHGGGRGGRTTRAGAQGAHLREFLADRLIRAREVPPERQHRVEALLGGWGWKEDDLSEITIAHLLEDQHMRVGVLAHEFKTNRRFLMDVVQALTVVNLQDVQRTLSGSKVLRQVRLPRHLRGNLKCVLEYIRDPYYQLALR